MKYIKLFERFISEANVNLKKELRELQRMGYDAELVGDHIEVYVEDLYGDDNYYTIEWYSDGEVSSVAYKDSRRKKFIAGNSWSEDITNTEDLIPILDGDEDNSLWESFVNEAKVKFVEK